MTAFIIDFIETVSFIFSDLTTLYPSPRLPQCIYVKLSL